MIKFYHVCSYVCLLLIFLCLPVFSCSYASLMDYSQPGPHEIDTLDFPDLTDASRKDRNVPLKIHYPEERGQYPLIIFSHGGMGTRDANIYQAQHLARWGYVVICMEHVFSNNRRVKYYLSPQGGQMTLKQAVHKITKDPQAVLERPKDVRFAIDQAERWNRQHAVLRGKININKIAMMGHSFGAYTTLVACGARPILDHLDPVQGTGKGLAPPLNDSRIIFGFAMSPQSPDTTYFGPDSYRSIDRPLVCLTGSRDVQKRDDGGVLLPYTRWQVFKLLPDGDKYFFWLKNADHFAFSDNPEARFFPSASRPDAQRISKALMVLFCDYFLKDEKSSIKLIKKTEVRTLEGEVINQIIWRQK